MPITKALLNQSQREQLVRFSEVHKTYPYTFPFNKKINSTNFPNSAAGAIGGGSTGAYFTMSFTPNEITPIVYLAAAFIILPNTSVDVFALLVSYKSTITFADISNAAKPGDEGGDVYMLLSNGGAINDYQVSYPINWFVAARQTLYMHVFAGPTTVSADNTYIMGRFLLGTLPTGA